MLSAPEPTCRANEQWAEFAMPGSARRMAEARANAQRDWNRSLQATGSQDTRRRDLHAQLEEAGAAGIITSQWPGSYGTTRVFNAYNREAPTFELSCEDYGLVYRLAANGQEPVLRLTAEAESRGEVPVFNVIGEIRGTDLPDEYVMLSAHYDSWESGSGATDNGSGSVLMLETMRILSAVYPNPKRTILIGLWSGEEQGLNGSRAFTEDHPEVIEGLQALFNQDNGTGRIVRLGAQGFTQAGGSLAKWLSQVPAEVSGHVTLDIPGSPGGGGSDYASFVCHGAPAFNLGALSWDYSSHTWHTHRDTYDKLVFNDLKNNAVLAATLVYMASEDPERVSRERRTVLRCPRCPRRPQPRHSCPSSARVLGRLKDAQCFPVQRGRGRHQNASVRIEAEGPAPPVGNAATGPLDHRDHREIVERLLAHCHDHVQVARGEEGVRIIVTAVAADARHTTQPLHRGSVVAFTEPAITAARTRSEPAHLPARCNTRNSETRSIATA